jgi:ATP-grasp domain-containing protein
MRRSAFILLGGFGVVCRNTLFIHDLRRRGLAILLITPEAWRAETSRRMSEPDHVASHLTEAAFVEGALRSPESFTSDVLAEAMRWRDDYDIQGVYAVGEVLVEQTGLVADALGVPFPGLRASRVCRSKALQRWYLHEWSPRSLVVPPTRRHTIADSDLSFPVVAKPASRHSSSGVRTYGSMADLRRGIDGYPDLETVLIEDRVVGPEFSVEALVQDGGILFESVTEKQTTESHASTFVELSHGVPSPPSPVNDLVIEQNRRVLRRLDFRDGIAHSEWRVTRDGTPYLMEIAARTPGDGLLPLYELATGRPMEPEIIRICLGEPASYPAPHRFARQVYLEHPEGRLDGVHLDLPDAAVTWVGDSGAWPALRPGAPDDPPALRAVLVLRRRGDTLAALSDSDDRAITFLIDAATPDALATIEAEVRSAIHLDVTPLSPVD